MTPEELQEHLDAVLDGEYVLTARFDVLSVPFTAEFTRHFTSPMSSPRGSHSKRLKIYVYIGRDTDGGAVAEHVLPANHSATGVLKSVARTAAGAAADELDESDKFTPSAYAPAVDEDADIEQPPEQPSGWNTTNGGIDVDITYSDSSNDSLASSNSDIAEFLEPFGEDEEEEDEGLGELFG